MAPECQPGGRVRNKPAPPHYASAASKACQQLVKPGGRVRNKPAPPHYASVASKACQQLVKPGGRVHNKPAPRPTSTTVSIRQHVRIREHTWAQQACAAPDKRQNSARIWQKKLVKERVHTCGVAQRGLVSTQSERFS